MSDQTEIEFLANLIAKLENIEDKLKAVKYFSGEEDE